MKGNTTAHIYRVLFACEGFIRCKKGANFFTALLMRVLEWRFTRVVTGHHHSAKQTPNRAMTEWQLLLVKHKEQAVVTFPTSVQ